VVLKRNPPVAALPRLSVDFARDVARPVKVAPGVHVVLEQARQLARRAGGVDAWPADGTAIVEGLTCIRKGTELARTIVVPRQYRHARP